MRVLVVEDKKKMASFIRKALQVEGLAVDVLHEGSGVLAAALSRGFDRFYRGDKSHSQAIEGCGLGLSIAEWIVKAHGGKIEITSHPEQTTTVTVSLPLSTTR